MDFSEYIGLPFKSLGRDRAGLDCCGLVLLVLRERFGIETPDYLFDYPSALDAAAVSAVVEREASTRWIKVANPSPSGRRCREATDEGAAPRPGDVVVFHVGCFQSHVGILIGNGRFLHIRPRINSCTQRLDSIAWRRRVAGFYRFQDDGRCLDE